LEGASVKGVKNKYRQMAFLDEKYLFEVQLHIRTLDATQKQT